MKVKHNFDTSSARRKIFVDENRHCLSRIVRPSESENKQEFLAVFPASYSLDVYSVDQNTSPRIRSGRITNGLCSTAATSNRVAPVVMRN